MDQKAIHFEPRPGHQHPYDSPILNITSSETRDNLEYAASLLKKNGNTVAFPTETVYGLGADATNDEAVRNIFKAKNRPSDNPLIVHIASLRQLRDLLRPVNLESTPTVQRYQQREDSKSGETRHDDDTSSGRNSSLSETFPATSSTGPTSETRSYNVDGHQSSEFSISDIPEIYMPLIQKFWPGPLTILLDLPQNTPLSKNVTAEQRTFAVRMPNHTIALALAHLSDLPIAAPSANASGKPSPTTASHVYTDLRGRIPLILDGGSADVGLESTVVSGLCSPPRILRPGGVSLEQIRACGGVWEDCIANTSQHDDHNAEEGNKKVGAEHIPLVPGMKYKHYSPRARVLLYEPGAKGPTASDLARSVRWNGKVGLLRTRQWKEGIGRVLVAELEEEKKSYRTNMNGRRGSVLSEQELSGTIAVVERALGNDGQDISRNLFAALRDMDDHGVDSIHIEGIAEDNEGLAVMNRLRKAASVVVRNVS